MRLSVVGWRAKAADAWFGVSLFDVDVHGLSGILIFGRVAPQATT